MSGRLLGAIAVPLVVLALVLGTSVAAGRSDVHRAGKVSENVALIGQLVTLRSAVFKERLAAEIFVPSRRPPAELLRTTGFGALLAERPERLGDETNVALDAIPPDDRPFTVNELDRARGTSIADPVSGEAIRGNFELVDARLRRALTVSGAFVRNTAIELGDAEMIRSGIIFEQAVDLPQEAGALLSELADLWAAAPADRPELQSAVAMSLATFQDSTERLLAGVADTNTVVEETATTALRMPTPLQSVVDASNAGELTSPERTAAQPADVGVALLSGVDWLLAVDELPALAARAATRASGAVSVDAREAEQHTLTLAVAAIAASVIAAVLFGRSIVRPVRRLTDQAERIGRGQLDMDPPDSHGPPEIIRASRAMSDMVGSLVLLERKSHALARADFDDHSLQEPLPGRLGAALQMSLEVLSDSIEQRESLQSRLEFEATHDSLTGVGNRASLNMMLNQMHDDSMSTPGLAAVVFIDLNDFKGINDRHGHAAGDEVLKLVASRMSRVAPARALVARLGGDEFVLALPNVLDIGEPSEVARRMTEAISAPIDLDGLMLEVGASAGVAVAGHGSGVAPVDPLELLRMADQAVYNAKFDPSNNIAVYDDELDRRLIHQREVEEALASAIHLGDDELHLVYQPIVRAADGAVTRVEALLRWNRAGVGAVMPDEFIPIAERSELIVGVDQWVIEAALRRMASWTAEDAQSAISVAVNISGRSLLDRSFVDRVTSALSSSGVEAGRLSLEITETALVSDLELAGSQLAELRTLGVRVVIDDFGTGYTSIAHLRALPIDELKIDGSFVQQLPDEENWVLIEMITELAHQLKIPTVAEGVETVEQVEMLRDIGCDSLQGYFFSAPIDPDELTTWLRHRPTGAEQLQPVR